MGELINGRTPEEIKAAFKHCIEPVPYGCEVCPYNETCLEHAPEIDAIALIERLESERDEALAKVPKWISVEERMPDTTNVYLIHIVHRYNKNDEYRSMDVRLFFKGEFETWQGLPDIYEVTHWMPMPEPPEVKSK